MCDVRCAMCDDELGGVDRWKSLHCTNLDECHRYRYEILGSPKVIISLSSDGNLFS